MTMNERKQPILFIDRRLNEKYRLPVEIRGLEFYFFMSHTMPLAIAARSDDGIIVKIASCEYRDDTGDIAWNLLSAYGEEEEECRKLDGFFTARLDEYLENDIDSDWK